MKFIDRYLKNSIEILKKIDNESIKDVVELVDKVRNQKGRIFFLGVGGGAGHCSHAVNDFRKIVGIECYAVTDNVSELTARINDEGWDSCYAEWLKQSFLNDKDLIFIFSVGGGSIEYKLSVNIVRAIDYAISSGAFVTGIVGRDGGHTAKKSKSCVIVPDLDSDLTTAQTESMQALVWHLIISHPLIHKNSMRWESENK